MARRAANGESSIHQGADGRWHGYVAVRPAARSSGAPAPRVRGDPRRDGHQGPRPGTQRDAGLTATAGTPPRSASGSTTGSPTSPPTASAAGPARAPRHRPASPVPRCRPAPPGPAAARTPRAALQRPARRRPCPQPSCAPNASCLGRCRLRCSADASPQCRHACRPTGRTAHGHPHRPSGQMILELTFRQVKRGGAEETRTPDPHTASLTGQHPQPSVCVDLPLFAGDLDIGGRMRKPADASQLQPQLNR